MKCIIFLAAVAFADAKVINKNDCGVIVDGIGHDKEVIKEYVDRPYQLAIDYNTNILYYSYSTNNDAAFELGYLNLKNNDSGIIRGVNGGFASAVDENTQTVYFGGSNGLYKLIPGKTKATNLHVTNDNIWQLFAKDGLYYSTYPNEQAYVYKNGEVRKLTEIGDTRAMLLAVDNSLDIVYYNSSGIFYYTKVENKTEHIGDKVVNGMTSDSNGKIYFSTPTGIYTIDDKTKEIKRLASIINIYGVAIESNGSIIYAAERSLIRLKSTGMNCS